MRHCCKFKPEEVYYLRENELYTSRKLSIGFCPICKKPVAELAEISRNGMYNGTSASGIKANDMAESLMSEVLYSTGNFCREKFNQKTFRVEIRN